MTEKFYEYLAFYQKFAWNWWNTLGPSGYVSMLLIVGISGYLMMLRGPKRIS